MEENILSIQPCFGRGDETYEKLENKVLNKIKKYLAILLLLRMQGSASFALEVMISNFIFGLILIIKTGVYSDRLYSMSKSSMRLYKYIKKIEYVDYKHLDDISSNLIG